MVALFGRFDPPIDQAATCDLEEASESSFRTTFNISTHPATGTGMGVVRKGCGTFDGRARSPKMVNVGVTFAASTRTAVCLA